MTVDQTVGVVMNKRKRSRPLLMALGLSALTVATGVSMACGVYAFNNRPPGITIPTPAMPADNGYDDFVRAGKLAKTMKHLSPLDMSGPSEETQTYANYKACAPEAAVVEDVMRRGLNKPYQTPPKRSINFVGLSEYAMFRDVARVLAGKARYEELSGHPNQAADTVLDGMEMGVTIPRGGNLISGEVGMAVEAISMRPLEEILPRLSEPQLARVAARLDTIAARRVSYADILVEEGNESTATLQDVLLDPKCRGLKGIDYIGSLFSHQQDGLTLRERLQAAKYVFANKRSLLLSHQAYFQALVEDARQPYHGASRVSPGDDPIRKALTEVFESARDKFAGMEAATTLLQMEVALQRYRLANGQVPVTLSELVPTYCKAVPLDACSGSIPRPLRYASLANGRSYLLYSVGTDMRDDGGKPSKYIGMGEGDIVAQHLWPTKMKPVKMPSK